ncbi:MAG: tyrosine-type recombinase/integrase [Verrucomicrobiae bacterium]|nr:tyrosine-type recombinase/integrase [Verrucomicrobiae bacterium]
MIFAESFEVPRRNFLEAMRVRSCSAGTLRSRNQSLDTFFRFLISRGVADVREVNRETVREYQLWLAAQPWTTYTAHTKLIALRRFFEHLEKSDAILVNPCEGMILPKLEKRLPRNVLTPAEARKVLDAPDTQTRRGIRDKAILELFYSTGIRLEEMAGLTIHDVDWRNGFLRVNKGKFAKDRVTPMGRKAADYVREYLQAVRAVWARQRKDERALWLSSIEPHGPLKKEAIALYVRQYGQAAGIGKRVSPHVWRHTCATHLVAGGSNLVYVQRLLGHRSLGTTQIYTRVAAPEVKRTFLRSHPRSRVKGEKQAAIEPQSIKGVCA